ncbi:SLATT domain-containing protein [uncultured Roseibium sp.]|uniref:SLATT domain-containing protein n=1 Tax=uncultured Roseibium sp. TaxID=1936171 RepID=UPI00260164C7|nr:SLATT domain-containing protein [uncultured Roseibium sp.]
MNHEQVKRLRRKMHNTKGARFESSKRLLKKYRLSVWSISILSLYVICVSVGLLIFSGAYSDWFGNVMTFLSVSMSVFIIILSLLNESNSYQLNADIMHNCAREILVLYNKIPNDNNLNEDLFDEYRDGYQKIINSFHVNHDELDRKIKKSKDPFDDEEAISFPRFSYFVDVYLFPILYMSIPIIAFAVSIIVELYVTIFCNSIN